MSKDTPTPMAAPTASPPAFERGEPIARPLRAAYHAGPPTVTFCGRLWTRGQAQEITRADWEAMQSRTAFRDLDFKTA